jgi:hypothetical protein
MLTADMPIRRASGHGTARLLAAALALLPATLFAQQPPPAAPQAAAPGAQAAPPAAQTPARAAPKPVEYKPLLTDLKGPSGISAQTDYNRMKQTGVITDPKFLNDFFDFKLKYFIWEARVENLPSLRSSLKGDLKQAGSAPKKDVHAKLTADTLKFMMGIVRDNYPPVVRYNAIRVLGDLNVTEASSLAKEKEAAVPHPDALTVLLAELENPGQLEAVKAGAFIGIKRHVEAGIQDPATKKKIAQIMLDLVRTIEPPANRSADGHRWLRSRAADLLAALGSRSLEGEDNQVVLALQATMTEKDSPWWTRLEALKALGSLDYTGAQGVPYDSIAQQMVELWLEMIEEESKEVPLTVAAQAAAGGGMMMMGGGMPGGGMPGGGLSMPGGDTGSYDGGGEGGGAYSGGGYAGGAMMQYDQYGNPIKPKPDRLVLALKDGYVAIQIALHGPGKPDPEKPRGIAKAAAGSEKAKQLIDGLDSRLKDFKTVLDEKFVEWQNRVTQLNLKAVEMKSWLAETAPPIVPPADVTPPAVPPTEVTAGAAVPAAQAPAGALPATPDGAKMVPAAAPATVPATSSVSPAAATVSATP